VTVPRNPIAELLRSPFSASAGLLLWMASCASTPPQISFQEIPSAEVLYRKGQSVLEGRRAFLLFRTVDYPRAIEIFQDIIDNYPYSDQAVLAELAIADSYFAQGRYDEALSYYQDFPDLHPDHDQVPYTIYRSALCFERQSYDAQRDQSATREALSRLDRLLSKYPHSPHAHEAERLWRELRTRLGEQAMNVGDFYLVREEYVAAAERYRSILNQYPGLGLDAEALYKLGLCYARMDRPDEARRFFQVILENYEGSEIAEAAAELVPAAH
jgi:outer membrane protein assembly factor BamD